MEALVFFSLQINFIKQIKTTVNEEVRSLTRYSKSIKDNYLQHPNETGQLKYISTNVDVLFKAPARSKIARYKKQINSQEPTCTNLIRSTNLFTTTPYFKNVSYIKHGDLLVNIPCFNLIYNHIENTCWIITIMHNIRANPALEAYILNNLNDSKIEKALKSVLYIDKEPISRDLHERITYLYGYGEDFWLKGGCETKFLESLLKGKSYTQTKWGQFPAVSGKYYMTKIDIRVEKKYEVCIITGLPDLPYFYICPLFLFPNTEYFKVSDLFQDKYENPGNIEINNQAKVGLDCDFEFLIFNLEKLHNFSNKSSIVKGVTIEKDIYINIRGTKRKQKYSLTGVSFGEVGKNYKHARAVIKINNTWYDTDYETIKYQNKYTQCRFKSPERLDKAFNTKYNETILIYSSYGDTHRFVNLLFYEKVDSHTNQENFFRTVNSF